MRGSSPKIAVIVGSVNHAVFQSLVAIALPSAVGFSSCCPFVKFIYIQPFPTRPRSGAAQPLAVFLRQAHDRHRIFEPGFETFDRFGVKRSTNSARRCLASSMAGACSTSLADVAHASDAHRQEMNAADPGLEGCVKLVYYPARRPDAA